MPGGGGTTTTTSTQNVNMGPWQPQQGPLQGLFQQAGNLWQNSSIQGYNGNPVVGFQGNQTDALNKISAMGGQDSPTAGAANNYLTNLLSGNYLNSNPYLNGMFNAASDAVTNAYQTATAPQTASAMEAAGRYGSGAYNQQVSQNEQNLGRTLNNLSSNIYGTNYSNVLGQMTGALGQVSPTISSNYINPTMELQAGNQQQAQAQNELTGAINQYMQNQYLPWQNASMYKDLISGNYGQSGTVNSTQQTPYYSNPMGSALGGLSSIAGTLGMTGAFGPAGWLTGGAAMGPIQSIMAAGGGATMLSDVRAKEDIAPIGKTHDGQNLYSYRYKGDPTPRVGLMAQEVMHKHPEAVGLHQSGYLMVDYDKALRDSNPYSGRF